MSRPHRAVVALTGALTLPLALPAVAQTGGFTAGDVYFLRAAWAGPSGNGVLVRLDPASGQFGVLHDLTVVPAQPDAMAYDPWRDRLIFFGGFVPNSNEVWLGDAAGNVESLGLWAPAGPAIRNFAPRGDGLIYFTGHIGDFSMFYFDASNQVQTLKDASGTSGYFFPVGAGNIHQLEYHAPTNSLVAAVQAGFDGCAGGPQEAFEVFRLQLSADGSRVLSTECTQFDLTPNHWSERPMGLSRMPGGDLLLVLDNDTTGDHPRLLRLDPATMSITPYASTTIFNQSSGTYSHVLGRAVVYNTWGQSIVTFGPGQSGDGTPLASNVGYKASLLHPAMVEILPAGSGFGMTGAPGAISVSAGGAQAWEFDFGPAQAGRPHLVLGSATGYAPPFPVDGVLVPLALDAYTQWTLGAQNTAILPGALGILDAQGVGDASLVVPAGTDPGFAGTVLHHAALAITPNGQIAAATNPVPVTLLP